MPATIFRTRLRSLLWELPDWGGTGAAGGGAVLPPSEGGGGVELTGSPQEGEGMSVGGVTSSGVSGGEGGSTAVPQLGQKRWFSSSSLPQCVQNIGDSLSFFSFTSIPTDGR